MPITVQINHPNREYDYPGDGYFANADLIIRRWNDDLNQHYRKFIRNKGIYVKGIKDNDPDNEDLMFWGEWEGHTIFHPLERVNPNGIHEPFHSIIERGCQNTDPYVFGEFFKYAICSQTGVMQNLDPGSLILFGTTTNRGFILDTVFIVGAYETAEQVYHNNAANYMQIYREETIQQLGETYLGPNHSQTNRIYYSRTWWDDQNYFSYVPCRISDNTYEKVIIPVPPMSKQKVGHPYSHLNPPKGRFAAPPEAWDYITAQVIAQGFYLGIRLEEPEINDGLLENF
jgi:hypothetical protein